MKTDKLIQLSINSIAAFTVVMLPFFFLPITANFYDFNKQILLFVAISALVLIWTAKIATERKFTWRSNRFDLPIAVFWVANAAAILLSSTNRVEALIAPMGFGTVTLLTLLYYSLSNLLDRGGKAMIHHALIFSGVLLAGLTVFQFLQGGRSLPIPEFMKVRSWSPSGALLITAAYLLITFSQLLVRMVKTIKKANHALGLLYIASTLLLLAGIGTAGYQLVGSAKPIVLPMTAAWSIAIETFKQQPLLGVGIENFETAFTRGKPLALNLGNLWNVRFGLAANAYFQILTTIGVLGLISFLWLTLQIIAAVRTNTKEIDGELRAALALTLLGFLLLPPSLLLLITFGILAALTSSKEEHREFVLPKVVAFIPPLIAAVLIVTTGYGVVRAYAAELAFKQSLDATIQNDGVGAYNNQIKAIQFNPYREVYHISYSRTNLALATNLARKKDLSDQERSTVSQLIQQSIREAKNAVILNRNRIASWENLADIYRQIMAIAKDADRWAIESYRQTIALDPGNPQLRIALGGVFFTLSDFDEAAKQFELAAQLKPDLANAFYNLSASYREKGDFAKAAAAMERVVALVQPDSNDYTKAKEELDQLKAKVEQTKPPTTGTPETLSAPQKPAATLNKPIVLPTPEAAPPKLEEPLSTPSPTP